MLKWICDIDFDINDIPEEYLADIIILASLVRNKSFKMFEAESILQTIVDVSKGKVPSEIDYPLKINTRALQVSFFYSKLYFALHSCLAAVGIKHLQVIESLNR